MKLIADAGSTKIRWALIDNAFATVEQHCSAGVNPVVMGLDEVESTLRGDLLPWIEGKQLSEVWYYGAGCIPSVCDPMARLLARLTGCGNIHVSSDMLGSVRGLAGRDKAVVCILGTGSNSCLCYGGEIVDNIPPLGYILGDEGSGAALGRRLVNNMLKRRYEPALKEEFMTWLGLSTQDIMERVYRGAEPNKFLASLTRFISAHIECDEMIMMVEEEFESFIKNNIQRYPEAGKLPVYFTGSIAEVFAPQLLAAMKRCGMCAMEIVADPLPRLIAYHTSSDY